MYRRKILSNDTQKESRFAGLFRSLKNNLYIKALSAYGRHPAQRSAWQPFSATACERERVIRVATLVVNETAVRAVVNAFVDCCSDDKEKLACLFHVLQSKGSATGLGYIVSEAIEKVAVKLDFVTMSPTY